MLVICYFRFIRVRIVLMVWMVSDHYSLFYLLYPLFSVFCHLSSVIRHLSLSGNSRRISSSVALQIPLSVINPVTNFAGVTSKAKLAA